MRLASALTNVFSKHARMTVDVANVFFSLLSLEVRRLLIKAFLDSDFDFEEGVGVLSALRPGRAAEH